MEKILAVEIQSDEWVKRLIPESTTPNQGRIEILKRNGVEISDRYIELYLKSDQEILDELNKILNMEFNQVTKLFSVFICINDYKGLKDYLLFHDGDVLVHFLRICLNNTRLPVTNVRRILLDKTIIDIIAEKLREDISFDVSYLHITDRMNVAIKLLSEENIEKYLNVLTIDDNEFIYYIFDSNKHGNYSSLSFVKWICSKVNETMGLDIPTVLQLLSFAVDNAVDQQVLDWKDEYKESKAISNVSLLMNELKNYGFSCMNVMNVMADDSDYTSYYIITAEGIARACLDFNYDELERAFISYKNEILLEWLKDRNDV